MPLFAFNNSYAQLPPALFASVDPEAVSNPRMVIFNGRLAQQLGLDFAALDDAALAQIFSGAALPDGAAPLAQAYAGHQFGNFVRLGDGRAHLLGEHVTPQGARVDVQLKGSGRTPFSRRGDGRAALGPMLREYVMSEALHALRIPTTRSLAVVTTGDPVFRDTVLPGAVLTRIASSHLRVGTFEYVAALGDVALLSRLLDYAAARHFPEIAASPARVLDFLRAVAARQTTLITHWLRVGFVHGVMNTDNMAISGETIDYGPCAFLDAYSADAVFSSIDQQGRYAFAQQPRIAQWNLARLAEALLPLLAMPLEAAVEQAGDVIKDVAAQLDEQRLIMMRGKLGLFGAQPEDAALIADLLVWMQRARADYTNTFRALMTGNPPQAPLDADAGFAAQGFHAWHARWRGRLQKNPRPWRSSLCLMRRHNPVVIPRHYQVEAALSAAEAGDLAPLHALLSALRAPYVERPGVAAYQAPPPAEAPPTRTFCGT